MSAPPFGSVPGFGAPGAPQQQPAGTFVLNVPADPNWEPFQSTDVLEKDGYYCARITKESARNDQNKAPGVFFEFQLVDQDVAGKRLMKFLQDPNSTQKNTWWLWRGLMRSVTGDTAHGKAAFQYSLGMLTNQLIYFKTEAYLDDGAMRTGVGDFITKAEYDAAVQTNRHRWAVKTPQAGGVGAGAGALPGGLPSSFPGMGLPAGGPTMPGAPTGAPSFPAPAPSTPQPPAQPPMQAAPPVQAPAPVFAQPAPAPTFAMPQQPAQQPPQPAFAPPAQGAPPPFAFAPPANGQNGAPQPPPTAAGLAGSFPGMPPR